MRKLLLIGVKDLKLLFRDRAALIFSLLAPFLLALGLGLVTGGLEGLDAGIEPIPVVLVNEDQGPLGESLSAFLGSRDLSALIALSHSPDFPAAQARVDAQEAVTAIYLPPELSITLNPGVGSPAALSVYEDETQGFRKGLVRSVLQQFLTAYEARSAAAQLSVALLSQHNLLKPEEVPAYLAGLPMDEAPEAYQLRGSDGQAFTPGFSPLALMAPGMALMFLMYTASRGGASLLQERAAGTHARLAASPTSQAQILGGKSLGIFMSGAAQMAILVAATGLLFRLNWGPILPLALLLLAAAWAATGWGLLIAAAARTPGQVNAAGSAMMLSFGLLGGSLISIEGLPAWLRQIAKITPNYWGAQGFKLLAQGGSLAGLAPTLLALILMGLLLFALAAFFATRRGWLHGGGDD